MTFIALFGGIAMKNNQQYRSLRPFQLIYNGTDVYVHRGFVFDVESAEMFDVEGATLDLRFEEPDTAFSSETDIYVKIETEDAGEISENESARVLSASIVQSSGPGGVKLGRVSNGIVDQCVSSDIYVYIPGRSSS